jgi:hypothetical protein
MTSKLTGILESFVTGQATGKNSSRPLAIIFGLVGLGFVAGALPMLLADSGVSSEQLDQAARIQVLNRLPHHLLWGGFATRRIARFGCLVLLWIFLTRRPCSREMLSIRLFVLSTLAIGFAGLLLSGIAESGQFSTSSISLLRLYWFRMEDVFVPLAIALECGQLLMIWSLGQSARHHIVGRFVVVVLCVAALVEGYGKFQNRLPPALLAGIASEEVGQERIEAVCRNWRLVCEWCKVNSPPNSLFLTPLHQQSFNWFAERAEFASWKNAPQDAVGIIEWQRRVAMMRSIGGQQPGFGVLDLPKESLQWLVQTHGLDYLLVFQREVDRAGVPEGMVQVYPVTGKKTTFCVIKTGRTK